jgi:putative tryptophan/tyrosine transport system substrate-binding protein
MRRREFIAGLGGTVAWPLAARAQQTALPVIGLLHSSSPATARPGNLAGFQQGLANEGYVEGRNLAVEYRWANGRDELLPELAADLVRRRVAVIVTMGNTPAALAAKAATQTIPTVFSVGTDPIEYGLVASLSRPGGNATGVSSPVSAVMAKRLQMLHEVVPAANLIAYLANPTNISNQNEARELSNVARSLGVRLLVLNVVHVDDIEAIFGRLVEARVGALLVSGDQLLFAHGDEITANARRFGIPTSYANRAWVLAGGLMSYETNVFETSRTAGAYTGRILKGEKPGDLPVQQFSKMEFVVSLKSAKALGLTIPPALLAFANEVIE